jgi:hypothetical protein
MLTAKTNNNLGLAGGFDARQEGQAAMYTPAAFSHIDKTAVYSNTEA